MKSKSYLFKITLLFICTCLPQVGKTQLVTNNIHPFYSLTQGFLGPDYTVSNIQYTGHLNAVGQFDGTATNLGLTNGIIMTTGTVFNTTNGPHGPNNQAGEGFDNGMPGYSMLNALTGNSTYNAAVIQFDFVPNVDSISINYVFASEEYMEYVGSSFNDGFAIYLSVPGGNGFEIISKLNNGQNVSINNVNNGIGNSGPCNNCGNYMYNGTGSDAPYNSSNAYLQYDGLTTGLRARKTGLQIGQMYTMIIAIADAGDGILDSGLFLERCASCDFNVGMNTNKVTEGFHVYPNPSSGSFSINFPSEFEGTIYVHDHTGKLIQNVQTTPNEGTILVSNLDRGIYILSTNNSTITWQQRIVID